MSRKTAPLALLALACLGLTSTALGQPKPVGINLTDIKNSLRRARNAELTSFRSQFPHLSLVTPCAQEFSDAVKAAEAEHTACLDPDNPPAGSPIAVFNNGSAFDQQKTCDKYTHESPSISCSDGLFRDQQKFCARQEAKAVAKAKSALLRCCDPLNQKKAELERELEQVKTDIQSCLAH